MHHPLLRHRLVLLSILCLALQGCRSDSPETDDPPLLTDTASYQLKGTVIASDQAKGQVTLDTEAIPGLMSAMIMPYKLAQPGVAAELHPGDHISARLRISTTASVLDQIDVTTQALPDYKPSKLYNVPVPGQTVPNFQFINQDAKKIAIDQFRGKVLLVTFIYTRCPLPEYCLRMSRNFADLQLQLAADPQLSRKTHLLSISFDPAYDTPKVLRNYGRAYTAHSPAHSGDAFSQWDFAAPASSQIDEVDQFFDVAVTPGAGNTLTHSLSTAIITPDGKIFRWYPTNDWTPATALADVKLALAQGATPQT